MKYLSLQFFMCSPNNTECKKNTNKQSNRQTQTTWGTGGTCLDVSQILHNGHWPFSPLLKSLPSLTTAAPTAPAAFGSPPSAISTLSKCPQKCPHSKNVPESHFPSLPILQLGLFNSKIHPRLPFRLFASLLEHFSGQFLPPALLAIKL